MTDEFSFIIAAVALLATPGPTNTLLATSGAASGFRKSLVLLLVEFLGYLIAIAVLITAMGPIVAGALVTLSQETATTTVGAQPADRRSSIVAEARGFASGAPGRQFSKQLAAESCAVESRFRERTPRS